MGKSEMLRAVEVRDAYRLIGECRDLGSDPALWCPRMLDGLRALIPAAGATGGEGLPPGSSGSVIALSYFESGLDERERQGLADYHRDQAVGMDPLFASFPFGCDRTVTRTRPQVVSDAEYHRSRVYDKYYRGSEVEHRLASVHQTSADPPFSIIHLSRPRGERDFSARERRLLNFFHDEIGPLVGRALVSVAEPSPDKLPPRLRQTLALLLEGDSEKQVAARLGLSTTTTHQYVTALYRRFGVRSRAQLMAYALKRAGRGRWTGFGSGGA